ncbi:MAG TPA: hypothetical protein VGQ37_05740 [Vicinamibacterales bacterium]|jgi:hypothetical protein|nr:hypothetical protein [Vicinamibacterales bacterium]
MSPRLHPAWTTAIVIAFVAAIVTPGAVMLARLDPEPAQAENRELAPAPAPPLSAASAWAFPAAASRYFEDHFGLRARLVRWQAELRLGLLRVSASPDVIIGRDGWLFYAGDGASEDIASAVPFTHAELEAWRATLQHTHDWLRARHIAYVFVVAPDKHQIYPEELPPSVHRVGAETRTDSLVRYLRAHSTVPVLDLRPALLAAKAAERVYHRTDTHWNDRGAYVAYAAIVRALGVAGEPEPRASFDTPSVRVPGLDLARMVGVTRALGEEDLPLTPRRPRRARIVEPARPDARLMDARLVTEQSDPSRPRAVVFRDSFGSALIPFLSEHFARAVYLWQYNLDPDVVLAEHPDVVIQEWVGRRFSTMPPYDPFAHSQ